jgi:hypothetical protein
MQWYLFDERDGYKVTCQHCGKEINGKNKKATSKYYILQRELYNEKDMVIVGSGCVKKFTGQTIKEIKQATLEAMRSR